MSLSIQNFNTASTVLSEYLGTPVELRDNPNRGTVGEVDPQDSFVRTDGAGGARRLGVVKYSEVEFRLAVSQAARDLAASGAQFSGHHSTDKVNKDLWSMGYGGKMQVRKFLPGGQLGSPADAIRDIFKNGRQYGFECATAMMVIFHKAILEVVGDEAFDTMFTEPRYLRFFRWSEKDADYLKLEKIDKKSNDLVPGSHYYYRNPDASDENSAFRGENVIYIGERGGEKLFYAHGVVGADQTYIVTEKDLLRSLSSLRRRGATTDPFRETFTYSLDANRLRRMVDDLEL